APRRRLRQQQPLAPWRERVAEERPVPPPRRDEAGELLQLRGEQRTLEIRGLEVVAQVRVRVLVVVALGQLAQLPLEALAAGVVLARHAPAVAAPVAERLHRALQPGLPREHGASLAARTVLLGIERMMALVA